jgi:hypothetical protein
MRFLMLLVIYVSLFTQISVARYMAVRQAPTPTTTAPPTQASASNALCATPASTEDMTDAALDRGVPFFLKTPFNYSWVGSTRSQLLRLEGLIRRC